MTAEKTPANVTSISKKKAPAKKAPQAPEPLDQPEPWDAPAGDDERFPTEEEYNSVDAPSESPAPVTDEPAAPLSVAKPKSKMTWAERMAALPPEEAAAARAKAAEASRRSKAKHRGTTPELNAIARLDAQIAKLRDQVEDLGVRHANLVAERDARKTALADAEAKIAEDAVTGETEEEQGDETT